MRRILAGGIAAMLGIPLVMALLAPLTFGEGVYRDRRVVPDWWRPDILGQPIHDTLLPASFFVVLLCAAAIIAVVLRMQLQLYRQRAWIDAVHRSGDPAAVGALVDLIDILCLRREVVDALADLLPLLDESSGAHIEDRHVTRLYLVLEYDINPFWRRYYTVELVLGILASLRVLGDARILQEVERMARGGGLGGRSAEVRGAAKECLPVLRERATRSPAAARLLRPAKSLSTDAMMLPRPANGPGTCDPQDLLRPALPDRGGREATADEEVTA